MGTVTKSSLALGGAGFSLCIWLSRRPRSKRLESPRPFPTQDLEKGQQSGRGVLQSWEEALRILGEMLATRNGEMLTSERCQQTC